MANKIWYHKLMNSKPASFFQRHRLLTAAAIIVALMIPGCIAVWLATRASDPQNLGPQLQYIGKANYGNLPFSDAQPYSEYYYATDMSIDDMKTYFPNAVFMGTPDGGAVLAQTISPLVYNSGRTTRIVPSSCNTTTTPKISLISLAWNRPAKPKLLASPIAATS